MKLRERLGSDIEFSYNELRKDFKGFFQHAQKISEAFQFVNSGSFPDSNHNSHHDPSYKKQEKKRKGTMELIPKSDMTIMDPITHKRSTNPSAYGIHIRAGAFGPSSKTAVAVRRGKCQKYSRKGFGWTGS